jgi:hypothetical protein
VKGARRNTETAGQCIPGGGKGRAGAHHMLPAMEPVIRHMARPRMVSPGGRERWTRIIAKIHTANTPAYMRTAGRMMMSCKISRVYSGSSYCAVPATRNARVSRAARFSHRRVEAQGSATAGSKRKGQP